MSEAIDNEINNALARAFAKGMTLHKKSYRKKRLTYKMSITTTKTVTTTTICSTITCTNSAKICKPYIIAEEKARRKVERAIADLGRRACITPTQELEKMFKDAGL